MLLAALPLASCDRDRSDNDAKKLPDIGTLQRIPMGPVPGLAVSTARADIVNPYATDARALADGKRLYVEMNCAYCHGWEGDG
ncbi:MAG: c-type cytochrome, partial [Gemmatimonadota bacterium]|nr:c-type cytochrome [Gemmatimonadota bacterium]